MAKLEDNNLKIIVNTSDLTLVQETPTLSLTYEKGLQFCSKTEGVKLIDRTKTLYLGKCQLVSRDVEEDSPLDFEYHREEMMIFFEDLVSVLNNTDPNTGILWAPTVASTGGTIQGGAYGAGRFVFDGSNFPGTFVSNINPDPQNPGFVPVTMDYTGIAWANRGTQTPAIDSGYLAYSPLLNKFVAVTGYSFSPPIYSNTRKFGIQSTDGVTWTAINDAYTPPRGPVIWCPAPWNIFVTVSPNLASHGYSSSWYYSADGINWTLGGPTPFGGRMAYANGVVTSVVSGGIWYLNLSRIASEGPGAIAWTLSDAPAIQWTWVTSNGSRFVAGSASGSNIIAYSDNGANWTSVYPVYLVQVIGLGCVGGRFIAVTTASGSYNILVSDDGAIWTGRGTGSSGTIAPTPIGPIIEGQVADGSTVGFSGNGILDNSNYYMVTPPKSPTIGTRFVRIATVTPGTGIQALAYRNGIYVGVGYMAVDFTKFAYSLDGITWQLGNAHLSVRNYGHVCASQDFFIACTYVSTGAVARSQDGINWTIQVADGKAWRGIASNGGQIVIMGAQDNAFGYVIRRSTDQGETWAAVPAQPIPMDYVNWVGYANNAFFAVGKKAGTSDPAGSSMWRSIDGLNWDLVIDHAVTAKQDMQGVAYTNGLYVLTSSSLSSETFTSSDGITWTRQASGVSTQLLVAGNGRFISGTSASGSVLNSANGVQWTASTVEGMAAATYVFVPGVYVDGRFVCAMRYTSISRSEIIISIE